MLKLYYRLKILTKRCFADRTDGPQRCKSEDDRGNSQRNKGQRQRWIHIIEYSADKDCL